MKHGDYSNALRDVLEDYITTYHRGNKLDEKGAKEFLLWIADGKCSKAEFAANHKEAFATIFKWRTGFCQSIVVAERAAELNPRLTPADLKAIAQQFVNGAPTKPLSKAAATTAQAIIKGGKKALAATAKKVLPTLMFLSAATAAKRGWAGEGHTGDGVWGAGNEVARDAICADLVEALLFPAVLHTIDGMVNLVAPGLNDPTRYRILSRGGVRIDMKTGEPLN